MRVGSRGRVVEGAEALPLDMAAEVPAMMVMGAGLIVHAGEDLLLPYDVAPHHLLLDVEDARTAGLLHTVLFHLMPMGSELQLDTSKCWMDVERLICLCYKVVLIGLVELTRTMLVMLIMLLQCILFEVFCRKRGVPWSLSCVGVVALAY